ncbi:MAG: amidophosphoribosyltransferase, partial [Prevotella sp.]|nr:amidophosphoribosyltransferase [Prevotella sp.]
ATIELLKERGMHHVIEQTYRHCLEELKRSSEDMHNCVREIYEPFTTEEINEKIVEMLRPEEVTTPIELVFQSIDGLHQAIPNHRGDWYFTGNYPTPGGTKLCNQAYVNYVEKI